MQQGFDGMAPPTRGTWSRALARASILALTVLVAACAAQRPAPSPPAPAAVEPTFRQEGIASWYGTAHHGRPTANGETYDMKAATAAHRTLPFGVIVRVTNLENGRSTLVRINDRGPYVKGRIIDLSEGAARAIGMRQRGTARVRVEQIDTMEAERPGN